MLEWNHVDIAKYYVFMSQRGEAVATNNTSISIRPQHVKIAIQSVNECHMKGISTQYILGIDTEAGMCADINF